MSAHLKRKDVLLTWLSGLSTDDSASFYHLNSAPWNELIGFHQYITVDDPLDQPIPAAVLAQETLLIDNAASPSLVSTPKFPRFIFHAKGGCDDSALSNWGCFVRPDAYATSFFHLSHTRSHLFHLSRWWNHPNWGCWVLCKATVLKWWRYLLFYSSRWTHLGRDFRLNPSNFLDHQGFRRWVAMLFAPSCTNVSDLEASPPTPPSHYFKKELSQDPTVELHSTLQIWIVKKPGILLVKTTSTTWSLLTESPTRLSSTKRKVSSKSVVLASLSPSSLSFRHSLSSSLMPVQQSRDSMLLSLYLEPFFHFTQPLSSSLLCPFESVAIQPLIFNHTYALFSKSTLFLSWYETFDVIIGEGRSLFGFSLEGLLLTKVQIESSGFNPIGSGSKVGNWRS